MLTAHRLFARKTPLGASVRGFSAVRRRRKWDGTARASFGHFTTARDADASR